MTIHMGPHVRVLNETGVGENGKKMQISDIFVAMSPTRSSAVATLSVIEYFAKLLKFTQAHSK